MASSSLRGQAAVIGTGTFGMGESPGFGSLDLAAGAGLQALQDAGLAVSDVDALFVCTPDDMLSGLSLAEYLGIHPVITGNNRTGGSAFLTHVMSAALALQAGLCKVALIAYGSNLRTGGGRIVAAPGASPHETPYQVSLAASYALAANRHMHRYGTTREQLAAVAVAARAWAQCNPDAFMREPLTIADVLEARTVATPFGVRDCCLVTDGGAAVVMTSAAAARDRRRRPAYLLGGGEATTHRYIAQMPDLTVTGAVQSGAAAYAQAGVRPRDVDVLQLYDAFTINPILFLEDLGFCAKGEGGAFVADGRIAPGGSLPVNTNGGGLSCVHPGMYGLFAIVEGVRQLFGECGERQVPRAEVALVHGNGGVLSHQATLIFGTPETL